MDIYSHADINGTFTNEANVVCSEPEWNYANNYDNATVVISNNPGHNKTANETRTLLNKTVEYYLTVTNVGEAMFIKNITLIDDLPSGVDYIEMCMNEYDRLRKEDGVIEDSLDYWNKALSLCNVEM